MHRFPVSSLNKSGDNIIISDSEQIHHLRDVLRLKAGDKVILFDEAGNEYSTVIEKILPKRVEVKIKGAQKPIPSRGKINLTVACAIPKKSKMDDIVDKLTQLGVDKVIPLLTQRVIIKLDKDKAASRLKRWRKIALNSVKQSQGNKLPIIDSIKNINEVLTHGLEDFDLKLIPTLTGKRKSLKEIIGNSGPKNILILIGPEGDFTPEEVDLAKRSGCIPVSLGDLVLRVETAAVAIASYIRLLFL